MGPKHLTQRGGSPEQYKHPCLIADLDFALSMKNINHKHEEIQPQKRREEKTKNFNHE